MGSDLPATFTWEQALAWRMERHRLVKRAAQSDLVGVVGEICGLHAQVMSAAELSLWARIDGLEREAVQETIWKQRALVKLWAMRGTLHLLPSAELGTWLSALGTYATHWNSGHPEMDVLVQAVHRALDGRVLTREELALAVEQITGVQWLSEAVRSSWGWILKPASFRGLCFAPSQGGRARFTTPAAWIGSEIDGPDSMDALREIARRYLASYAPLTVDDLGRWWGDGRRPGPRMLAALGEEAVQVDVGGQRAWMLARDVGEMASSRPPHTARLLPAFDPWVIGALIGQPTASRCAELLLGPGQRTRIFSAQGWVSPVLLVDGRMAGVWKHVRKGRRLTVEIEPFAGLPAWSRTQLEVEAERLAEFLGCELVSVRDTRQCWDRSWASQDDQQS